MMNRTTYVRQKTTYGCRRHDLSAAITQRNRTRSSTISTVLSNAAMRAWVLWASKMNGRKSTVTAAIGNRTGESAIVGEKSEPPFEVLSSTLVSAAPRPSSDADIQGSARLHREHQRQEQHQHDRCSLHDGSQLSVLAPALAGDERHEERDGQERGDVRPDQRGEPETGRRREDPRERPSREQLRDAVRRDPHREHHPGVLADARGPEDERRKEEEQVAHTYADALRAPRS